MDYKELIIEMVKKLMMKEKENFFTILFECHAISDSKIIDRIG